MVRFRWQTFGVCCAHLISKIKDCLFFSIFSSGVAYIIVKFMSGLYTHNFSPARTVSPHIRSASDVDRQAIKVHNFIRIFGFHVHFLTPFKSVDVYVYVSYVVVFSSQYLTELLAEYQKLVPFVQVLPICSRLLNQGWFFRIQVYLGSC